MSNYPTRNIAEIKDYPCCNKCGRYWYCDETELSRYTALHSLFEHELTCTAQVVSWQSVGFATHSEYVAAKRVLSGMKKQLASSDSDGYCYFHLTARIYIYETKNNIKL